MPLIDLVAPNAILPALKVNNKKQALQEIAARAAVHAVRAAPSDAGAIAEARQSLTSLAAPELYGHDQLPALTAAFDFRVDPERRADRHRQQTPQRHSFVETHQTLLVL